MEWDLFICHAFEDKAFVTRLAKALRAAGLKVWYDEFTMTLGDSLRESIDHGLTTSRFGIVVFSPDFFNKRWTQYELNGLIERDLEKKVILPIWHKIDKKTLLKFSPSLANKVAINSRQPMSDIVEAIKVAMVRSGHKVPGSESLKLSSNSQIQLEKPRLDLLRDLPAKPPIEKDDKS